MSKTYDNPVRGICERMKHRFNQATLLTNKEGDNIGAFVDIEDWRALLTLIDELDWVDYD